MISAEKSILGCILKDQLLIPLVRTHISETMFLDTRNSIIYSTAINMFDEGENITHTTVGHKIMASAKLLNKFGNEIDLQDSFMELVEDTETNSENWQDYAQIIVSSYKKTHAANEAKIAGKRITDGADASSVVEELSQTVMDLERTSSRPFTSFLSIAEEEVTQMEKRANEGEKSIDSLFVPTPFESINHFIYGFRYGSLSLLGARPAVGKTTVAVSCAVDAAKRGIKTLFISIEMNKNEIAQKIFSHSSGIHFNKILESYNASTKDWDSIVNMMGTHQNAWSSNLSIDDSSETPEEVMRSIEWGIQEGVKYIIIDHLHELPWGSRSSHISLTEAIGDFVKRLRNKAQRNDIAVLALCQLNREIEKRSSKIPIASDLGESGALERVAHNILFLHRAEQNNGEIDIVIAKARGGKTGITTLDFDGGTNKVRDQKWEHIT